MTSSNGNTVSALGADRWCILRTAGQRTLALRTSLVKAGVDAWTPQATHKRRLPRSKVKRETEVPIMPTFVFARASHLAELRRALAAPVNPHPAFSIFRFYDRIPLLADREMESLRLAERRAVPKAQRPTFPIGQRVMVPEGSFTGLTGVVEKSDGRFTLVCFGSMEVKIATFLLQSDEVEGA